MSKVSISTGYVRYILGVRFLTTPVILNQAVSIEQKKDDVRKSRET
jgi:hypothetical protein